MYQNITMVRGDTLAFGIKFIDLDQDLDSAYLSCKKNLEDEEYIFQKSIGDGITRTEEGYRFRVAPADTASAETGNYFYDVVISVNDDVYTILNGMLSLIPDVTEEV